MEAQRSTKQRKRTYAMGAKDAQKQKDEETRKNKGYFSLLLTAINDTIKDILERPQMRLLGKYLFLQPALYVTLVITFTYLIAYFEFSIIWCFAITTTVGSTCKVLLKRKIRKVIAEERHITHVRLQTYPEKETCKWLNNILTAVYGNHHLYISHLFVRFASPLLQKLCTPPPIDSVEFRQLDVTGAAPHLFNVAVYLDGLSPTKNLLYDFDVRYTSSYNGIVVSKLSHTPELPVFISNLKFKCRMRFALTFVENRFPFISSLRWSLLERPEIDISVKAGGLPGMMEMPTITEHFLDLVKDEMYENIGSPKYVEADFLPYIQEGEIDEEVDRFVNNLNDLIPEMIKHGGLAQMAKAPEDSLDPDFPVLGVMSSLSKVVKKISRVPGYSTPTPKRKPSPTTSITQSTPKPPKTPISGLRRSNSESKLNLLELVAQNTAEAEEKCENKKEIPTEEQQNQVPKVPSSPAISHEFHSRRFSGLLDASPFSSPKIRRRKHTPKQETKQEKEETPKVQQVDVVPGDFLSSLGTTGTKKRPRSYTWDSSESPITSPVVSRNEIEMPLTARGPNTDLMRHDTYGPGTLDIRESDSSSMTAEQLLEVKAIFGVSKEESSDIASSFDDESSHTEFSSSISENTSAEEKTSLAASGIRSIKKTKEKLRQAKKRFGSLRYSNPPN